MQYLLVTFAPVLAVDGHVVSLALVGGLVAGAVGGFAWKIVIIKEGNDWLGASSIKTKELVQVGRSHGSYIVAKKIKKCFLSCVLRPRFPKYVEQSIDKNSRFYISAILPIFALRRHRTLLKNCFCHVPFFPVFAKKNNNRERKVKEKHSPAVPVFLCNK